MKLAFGADHAGFELKDALIPLCRDLGHEIVDLGVYDGARSDYPDFAAKVARAVQAGEVDRGVLCCGSGIGMAIAANRFRGVRAVCASTGTEARLARQHNDANVLCLGSRLVGASLAEDILTTFLSAEFEGGRHAARIAKIDDAGL